MENFEQTKQDYVVVIGGANVDILGIPFERLTPHDSAPGKLEYTSGGVGRNITENLARLGVNVKFITAFGKDANGDRLKRELEELGVDLSYSLTVDGENTSTYICLNDSRGEMQYALSDMEILNRLDEEFFADKFNVINGAKCVVLDTNLGDILGHLEAKITVPIFLDTVSSQKTAKCRKHIKHLFFVKPNVVEAEALTGDVIRSKTDVERAAQKILELGNKNVVISLGANGVYFTNGYSCGYMKNGDFAIVSTTGAGDAFMAAEIYGYMMGKSIEESTRLGLAAAKITISSMDTVSGDIIRLKTQI
ncbi:MAG: carbohydrate kinase family protein [Clostridia bacterium]|nr:carbohydrate kinase family protein [Clostridia bacterium]